MTTRDTLTAFRALPPRVQAIIGACIKHAQAIDGPDKGELRFGFRRGHLHWTLVPERLAQGGCVVADAPPEENTG